MEGDGELAVPARLVELVDELIALRKRLGVSQRQMAHRAGLTAPLVNHLETGRRRLTVETLERLAGPLGHDVEIRLVDRDAVPAAPAVTDPLAAALYVAPRFYCPACHFWPLDGGACSSCRAPLQPVYLATIPRELS